MSIITYEVGTLEFGFSKKFIFASFQTLFFTLLTTLLHLPLRKAKSRVPKKLYDSWLSPSANIFFRKQILYLKKFQKTKKNLMIFKKVDFHFFFRSVALTFNQNHPKWGWDIISDISWRFHDNTIQPKAVKDMLLEIEYSGCSPFIPSILNSSESGFLT